MALAEAAAFTAEGEVVHMDLMVVDMTDLAVLEAMVDMGALMADQDLVALGLDHLDRGKMLYIMPSVPKEISNVVLLKLSIELYSLQP